jgi:phosphoenolpyruvate-protein phosphotransferase/dihydroxyacetone kinase phosphotransfer subunit
MVGIVLVSHSELLARGIEELLRQMVGDHAPIASAAGIANPESPIGTEPVSVWRAIESVYSDDGVVVLMDLGSAIMSAETALEFLAPEQQPRVILCEAPLVEGAIAAAVRAATGGSLEQVLADARSALSFKTDQLALPLHVAPNRDAAQLTPIVETPSTVHSITLVAPNPLGLHARPAVRLVESASRFAAQVDVTHGDKRASVASISQLVTLGVRSGDTFTVHASGEQAIDALMAIQSLVADNFGDRDGAAFVPLPEVATGSATSDQLVGIPTVAGVAIGPVLWHVPEVPPPAPASVGDSSIEWQRLQSAIQQAAGELTVLRNDMAQRVGDSEASIFDAHLLMLRDPDMLGAAQRLIGEQAISAGAAWQQAIDALADQYRHLADAYLARRAADVIDLGQRVLRQLTQMETTAPVLTEPVILVAYDLRPSDIAQLDPQRVLGIVTVAGGATGHAAILARALGIPTVVGVGDGLRQVRSGQVIALDGAQGRIWLQPPSSLQERMRVQADQRQRQQAETRAQARQPVHLRDGKRIEVAANINGPGDVTQALANGADGVGVFRTEFLLLGRSELPDEEEQVRIYRSVAAELGSQPLIVRTYDIGGDKPTPLFATSPEANPFLGRRGIRLCLDVPLIFRPQLRALLRAAVDHDIKIMLPMVSTIDEVLQTRDLLRSAQAELHQAGIPYREGIDLGIMIETPASVLNAAGLARAVEFFSIGTNDLAQYVMAADRTNARVSGLANALQPAVIRAVAATVAAAHAAGIWAGVCGELAGEPLACALLIGLGVDELSMSAPAIPQIKAILRNLEMPSAEALAEQVLALQTVNDVETFLEKM